MVFCDFCEHEIDSYTASYDHLGNHTRICDVCNSTAAHQSGDRVHREIVKDVVMATRMLLAEHRRKLIAEMDRRDESNAPY